MSICLLITRLYFPFEDYIRSRRHFFVYKNGFGML